jgi:bifunctional DNA-binding transcriptional regulator/antitoxin component of YhaV-PrlF toxin-antitoxin module
MTGIEVDAKGRVALPKDVLRHLGVGLGGKLAVTLLSDGAVVLRADRVTRPISDAFSMFKRPGGHSLSIEDMRGATSSGWARDGDRLLPAEGGEKVPRRGG